MLCESHYINFGILIYGIGIDTISGMPDGGNET